MKKYAITLSRWCMASLALLAVTGVQAEVFKGFPDVIVCQLGQGVHSPGELVFYLEGRDKNGTTYYKDFGRQTLEMKVGGDGIVRAEMAATNDCVNQSIRQLHKRGRTFNYARQ